MAGWVQQPVEGFGQWKPHIWNFVSVAIRVPPLVVMDLLLANEFSAPSENQGMFGSLRDLLVILLLYSPLFLSALVAFMLGTRQLLGFYLFLSSFGVLFWSYISNWELVETATALTEQNTSVLYECTTLNSDILIKVLGTYALQWVCGIIFRFSAHLTSLTWLFYLWVIFIGPTIFTMFSPLVSNEVLLWTPVISVVAAHLVLIYGVLSNLKSLTAYVVDTLNWVKAAHANDGYFLLLKSQWTRLNVPQVLRLFCVCQMLGHASVMIADSYATGKPLSWIALGEELLVRGCNTTISVMGVTSLFGMVVHYITVAVQAFLQKDDIEEQMGTVSSMLFFILAMQSGLPGMSPESRIFRLYQNVCLILTAMLHYTHSMINSLLQLLGASLNSPIEKHVRALLGCVYIVMSSVGLMYFTWTRHDLSPWLVALSCFSVELIAKVAVSLVIYVLFMVDARSDGSWEPFDDYLYAARAFNSCLELFFATLLVLNAVWILLFEECGWIRGFMIGFHGYFNVWSQAKQSWANSVRRQEASRRLADFRRATPEELNLLNDVCAICHHEMEVAIVTDCDHFYHVTCLRRWLFMQNHCPICHAEFDNRKKREQHLNFASEDEEGLFTPPQPETVRRRY